MPEVTPRCGHFGVCGGCQWQDVPYPEQLARKRTALTALLAATRARGLPEVAPVVPMPVGDDGMPWAFRHKAAFVFANGPRGLVMGHFATGGRTVVAVRECPVHGARANRIAFRLHDELARAQVAAAGPRLDGVLRYLIVRTSADERDAVALLVVTRNDPSLRRPVRALLASPERPDGFFLNLHDRPSPYMVGPTTRRLDGHAHVRERRIGPTFLVSPTAFFQTNPEAAAALVALVLDEAESRADGRRLRIGDLYAGSGLFTVPLAARGHTVTAIEENRQATADAVRTLEVNQLAPNAVRVITARVEDALPDLERRGVDLVVLDPPRQGCPPQVVDGVFGRLAPPLVIYVSCNPEALAAELPAILGHGYRAVRIQPVDMFPHTPHVETVAVFARQPRVRHATAPVPGTRAPEGAWHRRRGVRKS
ncbi:MAG: 23S rRNA (uracil(1939)-C(5))-methyltransferase RlmD [Vicinamibacterales bacterium]